MIKTVDAYGPLDAKVCFVGQSPGYQEGLVGKPFVGPSGQVLRGFCNDVGVDHEKIFWDNICNRVLTHGEEPTQKDIECGIIRLGEELSNLSNLKFVVLVGLYAAHLVFEGKMGDIQGKWGKLFGKYDCMAIWHPSAWLRTPSKRLVIEEDTKKVLLQVKSFMVDKTIIYPTRKSFLAHLFSQ